MSINRWIAPLLSLLMLVSGPAWAACPMTSDGARMQMQWDMAGRHSQMPSSHQEMPCKDATPQCVDSTGCVTLAALTQSDTNLTPPYFLAAQLLPDAVNGHSLSIKPDIPPPIVAL